MKGARGRRRTGGTATVDRAESFGPGANGVPPTAKVFDLTAQSEAVRRWDLPALIGMVSAGGASGLVGLFMLFAHPVVVYGPEVTVGIGLFLVAVGAFTLALSYRMLDGSARRITVDENQIILDYPRFRNGRRVALPWKDLPRKIRIQDARTPLAFDPRYLSRRTGILWVSPPPTSDLTAGCMDAIIDQAKRAGLEVTDSVRDASSLRGVRVVEITARSSRP
jgi:hypothetical protein